MAKKKELEKAGLAILQAALNANKTQNTAAGIGAGLRAVAQGKTPGATPGAVRTPPAAVSTPQAVKVSAPSGGLSGQAAQVANTIGKFVPAVKPAAPPNALSGLTLQFGGAVNGLAAGTVPAVKPAAPPNALSGLTLQFGGAVQNAAERNGTFNALMRDSIRWHAINDEQQRAALHAANNARRGALGLRYDPATGRTLGGLTGRNLSRPIELTFGQKATEVPVIRERISGEGAGGMAIRWARAQPDSMPGTVAYRENIIKEYEALKASRNAFKVNAARAPHGAR